MPSPQSVTRVIQILEALCASPKPVGLAELARDLATPKSSLSALLRGLADLNYVVAQDGAYRLGPGAFGLGSALLEARRRFPASELVRAGMRQLAENSGETVLFCVGDEDHQTMTYVDVIESRNAVRFSVSVGDRRALYATAGGRALLSAWPEEALAAYLDALKPAQFTGQTEIGKQQLATAIAAARADGVAQTIDQAADGVTGTGAVIHDAHGGVIGALVVAAPSSRMQEQRAALARLVRDEAAAISRSLGWRPA